MPQSAAAVRIVRARSASEGRRRRWAEELTRTGLGPLGRNFPGGALLVFDDQLRFLAAGGSGGLAEIGLSREMVEGKTLAAAFGPDLAARLEGPYRQALTGKNVSVEVTLHGRTLQHKLAGVHDDEGALLGGMCFVQDLTASMDTEVQDAGDRKRHQLALVEAHHFQQAVFAVSPDAIHVFDVTTGRMQWTSRSLESLLGYTPEEIDTFRRSPNHHIIPDEDFERFNAAVSAACDAEDGDVTEIRHRVRHRDGRLQWVSNRLTPFQRDESGAVTHLLGVTRDVTDVIAFEDRLEHAALHDDLTGLPNRRLINRRLGEALEQSAAGGDGKRDIVVLFCDLDGFKRVNDAHGHQIGDALLRVSASRLVSAARTGDTVGRMGGDEFVVILAVDRGDDPAAVGREVAERVIRAVGEPLVLGSVEHAITASIGICVAQPGTTPHDLLRDADTAMFQAKLNGKAGYAVFVPTLREDARTRDELVRNVRQSLADNTLDVHYQPIVEPGTGRVVAVEALVRIPGPDGQLLDTAAAISAAEQTGLIGAIGERVLRRSCEQTARWRRTPQHANLTVAVNLSASEIARPGLYDRVTAIVRTSGLEPGALTLEITESVLLDAGPSTVSDLRRLHTDGIGIAIDDFGTGYAGLRYLATLPVTSIKIDRSFTSGLPHNAVSATIVRATVGLAAELRLKCVVEGVETGEQLQALPQAPRLLVQGWHFARPQPASAPLPVFVRPQAR